MTKFWAFQNESICRWHLNKTEKLKYGFWRVENIIEHKDHDGPISLTRVLNSKGQQSYVPTCDP